MSIYCGKCDFYDTVSIYGIDRILNHYEVFHNGEKIDFNGDTRLMIPWYPYIVGAMGSSSEGGRIYLSRYPYPYEESMSRWQWITKRFKNSLKYNRSKARKQNKEFDEEQFIEDFVEMYSHPLRKSPLLYEVCEKLAHKKRGEKIKYPLIRVARRYMTDLCNEMAKNGLDPAEYGYVIENGEVIGYIDVDSLTNIGEK